MGSSVGLNLTEASNWAPPSFLPQAIEAEIFFREQRWQPLTDWRRFLIAAQPGLVTESEIAIFQSVIRDYEEILGQRYNQVSADYNSIYTELI